MMGGPKKAGALISGAVWANAAPKVGRPGEAEPGGREAMGGGVADWGGALGALWGGDVHAARFL